MLAVLKGKKKNLSQDPTKCFPYNRPSAQTCLLTAVFQKQFKKKKKKRRVENSVSFTRLFCPRCVLNFVRIINCVPKHEDKLALWPLMRWHNSSERFIALHVSSQFPTILPILLTPLKIERGAGEGESENRAGYVVLRTRCWKAPSPPVNTILLSGNHSLRETK